MQGSSAKREIRLLLLGASGVGTSTLGQKLAERLGFVHLESDGYYWEKTNPPFEKMRDPTELGLVLRADLDRYSQFISSGSFCVWGHAIDPFLTHVIFLSAPVEVRIQRILARERARYGEALKEDPRLQEKLDSFAEWSRLYDVGYEEGNLSRCRKMHEDWLLTLSCPVLRLDSHDQLSELERAVLDFVLD